MRDVTKPTNGLAPTWNLYRDGITQSMIRTWLECPEKFRLQVQYGVQGKSSQWSTPLSFGSAFHDIMANTVDEVRQYMTSKSVDVMLDVMEDKVITYRNKQEEHIINTSSRTDADLRDLRMDIGMAAVLLKHYFTMWAHDFGELDWVALEQEFKMKKSVTIPGTGSGNVPVRGKMDGVYRSKDGKLWLFETKTKSRIDDKVATDRLPYEMQVLLYLQAVEYVYDEEPAGVMYNMIRRPALRQKVHETDAEFLQRIDVDVIDRSDTYFLRYECPILPEERARWAVEFDGLIQNIVEWYEGKYHFRNSHSCVQNWGACPMLDICSRGYWGGHVQVNNPFPELEVI